MPFLFADVERIDIVLDLYFSKSFKQWVHMAAGGSRRCVLNNTIT